jgi:phosphoribosylformylglycinamidine synthase subunit PurL
VRELALHNVLRELIRAGHVRSAHDCSEGGLAVALAEACFNPARRLGAEIDLGAAGEVRLDHLLFNESQSRVVISIVPGSAEQVMQLLKERGVSGHHLGVVGGDALAIATGGETLRWPLEEIYHDWFDAIENLVRQP